MDNTIDMEIVGFGFVFYSPFSTSGIANGEDYLASGFEDAAEVEKQAIAGRIVGVSTGSPGTYSLKVNPGYPSDEILTEHTYKLRVGVEVRDRTLCVKDIFDLLDWRAECPVAQTIELEDGFYHVTLLSNNPASGVIGDNQEILVYLQKLDEMPRLRFNGVPTLC